ncbi:MAG: hypothetical protein NWP69_14585 [Congregibacter sp.]|nr:hypothetical protein [Congregibacter sp.]
MTDVAVGDGRFGLSAEVIAALHLKDGDEIVTIPGRLEAPVV